MAKPNYSFEKRKKELDRKKKQEEKSLRKQDKTAGDPEAAPDENTEEAVEEAQA